MTDTLPFARIIQFDLYHRISDWGHVGR